MFFKDEWLSQYFEYGAYQYDPSGDVPNFPKGFIYSKISLEKVSQLNFLLQKGFKLLEISVQFDQKKTILYKELGDFQIEFSVREDRRGVVEIAEKAFIFSRFYQDEEIPTTTANQIKTDWVSNFFKGQRGDKMIVARKEGRIVGFLLLIERCIDLIAVSPSYIGKGIASAMLRYANQEIGLLRAGTQLINKPSIALYEKSGFFLQNAHYILHRHIK